MTDLFAAANLEKDAPHPLADRLRPQSLTDVAGQDHTSRHPSFTTVSDFCNTFVIQLVNVERLRTSAEAEDLNR